MYSTNLKIMNFVVLRVNFDLKINGFFLTRHVLLYYLHSNFINCLKKKLYFDLNHIISKPYSNVSYSIVTNGIMIHRFCDESFTPYLLTQLVIFVVFIQLITVTYTCTCIQVQGKLVSFHKEIDLHSYNTES